MSKIANKLLLAFSFSLIFIVVSCRKDNAIEQPNVPIVWDTTDYLKINQLQVIGSHNSYRLKTYEPMYNFVQNISGLLPAQYDPDGWDYTHLPLEEQFSDYGIRSVELDIYNDPNGGLFATRRANGLINEPLATGIAELQAPGMKMLHVPDFDYMTNYYTFVSALTAIKNWSDENPRHIPIIIHIEAKEDGVSLPGFSLTVPVPYDAAAADAIDTEIKSVFGEDLENVITPDKLRGNYSTLSEAAENGAWPMLGDARGKVIFVMQGGAVDPYLAGHPVLENRAVFLYSDAGNPETAFVILNNAVSDEAEIQQTVAAGYMVRTRSDANTDEARSGDYSAMNAAFTSGAHIISTDYYKPDPRGVAGDSGWTDFQVRFPNGELARINPVSAADKQGIGEIKE
ncbi:MAG: hypothetical protein POELPBGB_03684 [Bacteroidia bacterium]|nr:hypothetical protein [Bacteroidia bacterium]